MICLCGVLSAFFNKKIKRKGEKVLPLLKEERAVKYVLK